MTGAGYHRQIALVYGERLLDEWEQLTTVKRRAELQWEQSQDLNGAFPSIEVTDEHQDYLVSAIAKFSPGGT